MAKTWLEHIHIVTLDPMKLAAFYEKVFGVKPHKQSAGYAKFDLKNPAFNFSMQSHADIPISKISHFGIEVDSSLELQAFQERLNSASIVTEEEKQTACCFARQDKAWFKDPDGNSWEIFHVYEQLLVHPSATADIACCR